MSTRLIVIFSFLWAISLMAMGLWWLYLILSYGEKLQQLDALTDINLVRMITWEGISFVILLTLLSLTLMFLYLKDQKKTKALADFFAGLTHELKTPLASIRLQSDVLTETVEEMIEDHDKREKLGKLTKRLNEDTLVLENQMDKILQLSRIERGGQLCPQNTDLISLMKETQKKWATSLDLSIRGLAAKKQELHVYADPFALELIFRNLFENTLQHSSSREVVIEITKTSPLVHFEYRDGGSYLGPRDKMTQLFFKHNSARGSGIGLYLIKSLTTHMKGSFQIDSFTPLQFSFTLPGGIDESR